MLTFSDMVKTNKNTEERELRRKEKKILRGEGENIYKMTLSFMKGRNGRKGKDTMKENSKVKLN